MYETSRIDSYNCSTFMDGCADKFYVSDEVYECKFHTHTCTHANTHAYSYSHTHTHKFKLDKKMADFMTDHQTEGKFK